MLAIVVKTSVIICTYAEDRWDDLVKAIESALDQSVRPDEVIVVVDHNPALLERVRARFPGIVAIENQRPRGLSGARNCGVEAAHGDILAFLDDDAVAAMDWLEQLLLGYRDLNVVGVGGAIEPLWESGRPTWFPCEFDWVVGCTYRGMPQSIAPVRNLIGANMSFRREVFAEAGEFRSGIGRLASVPVGCEETELCIRALQLRSHWIMLYNPAARVKHRVPPGRACMSYFRARCYAEGLSKAQVALLVGAEDGLASERSFILRTLPQGVLGGIQDATLERDWAGLGRAAAIIAGLTMTTIGYGVGYIKSRFQSATPLGGK